MSRAAHIALCQPHPVGMEDPADGNNATWN
ncbi:hypothetical protein JOE09_001115 [Pantoea coffeiphila]|nr:hypothetical protein [Pantoea coffeiphila]